MGNLLFLTLIFVIMCSATWVVVSPNLVHSAVSLLITLFSVAGLYVFLYADFLAATQVVIYVGGILVLIIFGVMLTNKIDKPVIESISSNKIIGVLISSFIFTILSIIVIQTNWPIIADNAKEGPPTVELIGKLILGKYLLPFELISILLLSALVGSALLARKKNIPIDIKEDDTDELDTESNSDQETVINDIESKKSENKESGEINKDG